MIKKFLSTWQEPFIGMPLLIMVAALFAWSIPLIDPRAGVSGLGFLEDIAQEALVVLVIFFGAWWYRHTYSATEENERKANADEVRAKYPLTFYAIEKLHQFAVILIIVHCFTK